MSEYTKSDIGEYLTNRTMSFEKGPPEFIWENVEKNIPVYAPTGTVSTMVKLVIGTMSLSAIIFAILWIKHQSFTSNINAMAVNQKTSIFVPQMETVPLISAQTNEQTIKEVTVEDNKNVSVSKNNQVSQEMIPSQNDKTYSINASGLTGVTEISFIDEKNNVVLSEKKPKPNSYGFYVIDISKLSGGSYSIMITTSEGTRLHKKETFK